MPNINDRTPRGNVAIICKVLQRDGGMTAEQIRSRTDAVTPHNQWSLQRIADRFNFRLVNPAAKADGLKRYQFTSRARSAKPRAGTRTAAKR
jgi:hypothetical protein